MQNPFGDSIFKLSSNQSLIKWIILGITFLISFASIIYTNMIVSELKSRENQTIQLYASALQYITNQNDGQNTVFINQEIISPNNSIPVIYVDEHGDALQERNTGMPENLNEEQQQVFLQEQIKLMREEHEPITIELADEKGVVYANNYVFYKSSDLLKRLKYYPYVQLSAIAVFAFLAYMAFNFSRKAEQNRVWIGLAKETAHQLGTPLSSLMAWVEYFRESPDIKDKNLVNELDKDIKRLEMITSRFSSIGSVPVLKPEDMMSCIEDSIAYLQKRVSTKVKIYVTTVTDKTIARINRPLFEWVIENIVKNAVDAMSGIGEIHIKIIKASEGRVYIDIGDNGKGMSKQRAANVFDPGFTTKKRGWGLGLTLAKRIIENYHQGKIFVKNSEVDAGTTFRIILKA